MEKSGEVIEVMAQNENMSLYELRELATRQQECIESTHQLIISREQKLKYLIHDQNLNHTIAEYDQNLHRLKESVSAQELKLRQLRTLKGQVHKQKSTNGNLCSELESIRTLFNEKEKELSVALTKVDALTRQLEELKRGNTSNSYHINGISNAKHGIELEKLRQELLYRSKLSEQNGHELMLKRGLLTQRQSEMVRVDKRISELQQRLSRKRQLNQQLSSQMHSNLIRANNSRLDDNELHIHNSHGVLRSSVGHMNRNRNSHTMRPLSANINIAAVEPVLREQTSRLSEFDQHINAKDFMGCKQDPKYQTLPYNTKFGVRQQSLQQQYNQTLIANHLCLSNPENDKILSELSNDKQLPTNSCLNNDNNNNNNHNNSVSVITNTINNNPKVMLNTKSPLLEERPSPSGSSGSSDRASVQNHNGIMGYKMQSQMYNMNCNSAQHPYQNLNPKMLSSVAANYGDHNHNSNAINNKQLKQNHILHNNNHKMNSNQSVIQSQCVPTPTTPNPNPNQTQSQIASNGSKVPPNTKPKPIVPPKPSVPVKPTPPPRQTPNHLFSAQIHSESLDMNAFSTNARNNSNSYSKKSSNLLTNSSINACNSGYNRLPLTSLAIQKTYNVINSKSGLMIQQLPHHCQQQQHNQLIHSYEDRLQSHLNRNSNEPSNQLLNLNETTDGSQPNGQSLSSVATDITSSTSSLSSSLSSQTNHINNYDIKSSVNISDINCNSLQSKSEDRECTYGSIKGNNKSTGSSSGAISSTINNNNNNLSNDWHKVKRRPVVANNQMEEELALQVSAQPKKSIESEPNLPELSQPLSDHNLSSQPKSSDCIKIDSNQSNINKNKIQCDLTDSKSDESAVKDNESDINLIKEQHKEETTREGIDSNLMIENNYKREKDCINNTDNVLPNSTLSKGMVGIVGAKRMKGNLKCQQLNSKSDSNNECNGGTHPLVVSRRVSFDPLALLLDAALEGELELVKKTAKEVPNPSAANDEGITALHNAICAGHFDIVKYLVENGCDVNAQDSDGWTPLHCAASCNNLSMVKFLVENGACIFATTLSDQETAAEKCEEDEEGFDGCSQYLYGVQEKLGILNANQVFAVYDYESQNTDELSFKDGNVIIVMRKGDEQEREWWWARITDREGYVPRNLLGLYPRVKPNKELQTIAEEKTE